MSNHNTDQNFKIVFGNIMDDSAHNKGLPLQTDRLKDIAEAFNLDDEDTPKIAAWSEFSTPENAYELAEKMGLVIVGEPFQYSPREWMAAAVDPALDVESSEFINYGKKREGFRPGFLTLMVAGVRIIIVHHPHQIFSAIGDRHEATKMILETHDPNRPEIIMGDFNASPFQVPRIILLDHGFTEVHVGNRPIYPNDGFRGKTFPRLLPNVSLDAIHLSPHFVILDSGMIENDFSDHRGLWVKVNLAHSEQTNSDFEVSGSHLS